MFAIAKGDPGFPPPVRRLVTALLLGAAACAMSFAPTHSFAETRAAVSGPGQAGALVAPAGDSARVPYQARLVTTCNSTRNRCDFTSGVVGGNRRLDVERVSCRGDHSPIGTLQPQFETFVYAEPSTGTAILVDLPEVSYAVTNTAGIWTISEEVRAFVPAGYRWHMYVSVTTGIVRPVACTISGYLVTVV